VGEVASRLTAQVGMPFNDVHAGLAFAALGDEAALGRLTDALQAAAERGHAVAGSVVLPLVQAAVASTRAEYEETIRLIEGVQDQIVRVGGSNAQREVFEDTLLQAYLRAGQFDRAERRLRARLDRRPSARDLYWLGQAELGTGQVQRAAASLDQARNHWGAADPSSPELASLAARVREAGSLS
jgi:TolA-binding protein